MSCGGTCAAQVFFSCDLSESVLSLPWVFPFCRVPFDGASFLGMSFSDLLVGLSPQSFPCLEECFLLLMGLFILGLTSSAPVGGFSVMVHALQWGLTTELVGDGTWGDFSWDFIFFYYFLGWPCFCQPLHHWRGLPCHHQSSQGPQTSLAVVCNV